MQWLDNILGLGIPEFRRKPVLLFRTLREQGLDGYSKVKAIWYEVDGKISVVTKEN